MNDKTANQNEGPEERLIEDEDTCRAYMREIGKFLLNLGDSYDLTKKNILGALEEIVGISILTGKVFPLVLTAKIEDGVLDGIQIELGDVEGKQEETASLEELGAKLAPSVAYAIHHRVQNRNCNPGAAIAAIVMDGLKKAKAKAAEEKAAE